MGVETGAGLDGVLVVHQQQAVVRVAGVFARAEQERMFGLQPGQLAHRAIVGTTNLNSRRCCHILTPRMCTAQVVLGGPNRADTSSVRRRLATSGGLRPVPRISGSVGVRIYRCRGATISMTQINI